AQNSDRDSYRSFFGDVSFHDVSVEGAIIEREKMNSTAPYYADFNDDRFRTTDDRRYVNVTYAHHFSDIVDVKAQRYYDRQDFNQTYSYANQGGGYYREAEVGEWWGTELQLTTHFRDRLTLTLGGEYRDDFRQQLD